MKIELSYIAILFSLFFISCSKEETIQNTYQITTYSQNVRTAEEARLIAIDAISMLEGKSLSTRTKKKNRVLSSTCNPYIVSTNHTRSAQAKFASDTLLYIYNYVDNNGFAVVSANKSTEGLLAVADSGHIEGIEGIDNPGLAMFMNMARNYVMLAADSLPVRNPESFYRDFRYEHDTIYSHVIEPKLNVRWGQHEVLGMYCPNGSVGCSNLAIFQVMSYFRYPTTLTLTYNNNESISLFWLNILRHKYYSCYLCSDAQHDKIAKVARELGYRNNSKYNDDGKTDTSDTITNNTLRNLGFNVYESSSSNAIDVHLNSNNIIIMSGQLVNDIYLGHDWICDGCIYRTIEIKQYGLMGLTWEYVGSRYTSYSYNHFDWGWGGEGNGYFSNGVYNACNAYRLDDGCSSCTDQNLNFPINVKARIITLPEIVCNHTKTTDNN